MIIVTADIAVIMQAKAKELLLRITVPADAPLHKFFLRKKGFTHHSILPFL